MQTFNLHTHTKRCGHAGGSDEQYVLAAIQGGFKTLGFSDHAPFNGVYSEGDRMKPEQRDGYIESVRMLQKKYCTSIDIKLGFESEYFEDRYDEIADLYNRSDYLILGQHFKTLDYEFDFYCGDEDLLAYVDIVEKALSTGMFTYVAHPDYFMLGRRSYDAVCEEAAHRIAKASLKYDVPLEVNLKGPSTTKNEYYNSVSDEWFTSSAYPCRPFWTIIASYGCKCVYGYDAHTPLSLLERRWEEKVLTLLEGMSLNFINEIDFK